MTKPARLLAGALLAASLFASTNAALAAPPAATVLSTQTVTLVVDGTPKYMPSIFSTLSYQDHYYVPLRFIVDQLGAQVTWNDQTHTLYLRDAEPTFGQATPRNPSPAPDKWIQVKKSPDVKLNINGTDVAIPSEYTFLNNNDFFYVPVRYISNMFGSYVQWDEQNRSILINRSIPLPDQEISGYKLTNVRSVAQGDRTIVTGDIVSANANTTDQYDLMLQVDFQQDTQTLGTAQGYIFDISSQAKKFQIIADKAIQHFTKATIKIGKETKL